MLKNGHRLARGGENAQGKKSVGIIFPWKFGILYYSNWLELKSINPGLSSYVFLHVIRPTNKQRFVPIAGNLVYRIPADFAGMQMIQDFQFFVQLQLLVKQLHQLLKTACAHMISPMVTDLTSEIHYWDALHIKFSLLIRLVGINLWIPIVGY
jgi:hypothetical protein